MKLAESSSIASIEGRWLLPSAGVFGTTGAQPSPGQAGKLSIAKLERLLFACCSIRVWRVALWLAVLPGPSRDPLMLKLRVPPLCGGWGGSALEKGVAEVDGRMVESRRVMLERPRIATEVLGLPPPGAAVLSMLREGWSSEAKPCGVLRRSPERLVEREMPVGWWSIVFAESTVRLLSGCPPVHGRAEAGVSKHTRAATGSCALPLHSLPQEMGSSLHFEVMSAFVDLHAWQKRRHAASSECKGEKSSDSSHGRFGGATTSHP